MAMPKTYVKLRTASGAETVTDQLAGTAVAFAGPRGIVRACALATVKTHTFLLKGRNSGSEVIPNGSSPQGVIGSTSYTNGKMNAQDFIFSGQVQPGEPLELTIVAAGAGDAFVGVQTE